MWVQTMSSTALWWMWALLASATVAFWVLVARVVRMLATRPAPDLRMSLAIPPPESGPVHPQDRR